jgi:hypothetical protein
MPNTQKTAMRNQDVREMVDAGDDMEPAIMREAFRAIYGREPDDEDEHAGLYSLIVAGLEDAS